MATGILECASRQLTLPLAFLPDIEQIHRSREAMMKNRKYPRLKHYDYRSEGAYFLTLTCRHRASWFGHIAAGNMIASAIGEQVKQAWYQMLLRYEYVSTDAFVIMPNHPHGILWLRAGNTRPLTQIMNLFKSGVTRDTGLRVWQRSFYERVIRDENELFTIRRYIADNPGRWGPGAHQCAPRK